MLHDRLDQLFESLGLDDTTPPDEEMWSRLVVALRHIEFQKQALIDAIPDVICRIRRDGTIVDIKSTDWTTIAPLWR